MPPPARTAPTAVVVFSQPAATPGHAHRGARADGAAHQVAPGEPVFVWMHAVRSAGSPRRRSLATEPGVNRKATARVKVGVARLPRDGRARA